MERNVIALSAALFLSFHFSYSFSSPIGLHPLDDKYYDKEVINCKDGSKSFTRDRLNDDFCDCPDGTDEPGTSACPTGKFYCRNVGSAPRFLFSSRVNDHICDCCDGSDEYDGTITCPNTCILGGNIVYQRVASTRDSVNSGKAKPALNMENSTQKFTGLKALFLLQVALIIVFVAFRLFRRRKSRRKTTR